MNQGSNEMWVSASTGEQGFETSITVGEHSLVADEPASVGGTEKGPTPYGLLLASVASCTAMTIRMYADRKKWPLKSADVRFRTTRVHAADCESCEQPLSKLSLERQIELTGDLSDEQVTRLRDVADRCPVKQALDPRIVVVDV
jgi:uncharacterized OsmC-like protein